MDKSHVNETKVKLMIIIEERYVSINMLGQKSKSFIFQPNVHYSVQPQICLQTNLSDNNFDYELKLDKLVRRFDLLENNPKHLSYK